MLCVGSIYGSARIQQQLRTVFLFGQSVWKGPQAALKAAEQLLGAREANLAAASASLTLLVNHEQLLTAFCSSIQRNQWEELSRGPLLLKEHRSGVLNTHKQAATDRRLFARREGAIGVLPSPQMGNASSSKPADLPSGDSAVFVTEALASTKEPGFQADLLQGISGLRYITQASRDFSRGKRKSSRCTSRHEMPPL